MEEYTEQTVEIRTHISYLEYSEEQEQEIQEKLKPVDPIALLKTATRFPPMPTMHRKKEPEKELKPSPTLILPSLRKKY
jgi:ribosome maturation protein Sdo1